MSDCFVTEAPNKVIPILPICENDFSAWYKAEPQRIKNIISNNKFLAKSGSFCLILDQTGALEKVLLGLENKNDFYSFGVLPSALPGGYYNISDSGFSLEQLEHVALGWGMGSYQFRRYKKAENFTAKLLCKEKYNLPNVERIIASVFLIRDLINTPAADLYPGRLSEVAENVASKFNACFNVFKGEDLKTNFPAVYEVGRASRREPLLIDLQYGDINAPKVVLIGKGVCFDSGGLQLKTASGMILMKKDMAGAAHALGLARMIMDAKLPINLRVIIPAVENLVSGDILKPGDVIKTRKGFTVEIINTDAEGRLILADALAYASEANPELIFDFATLTTAARIALGPDISALFTNTDDLAQNIAFAMAKEQEPVWRMPLYNQYLGFIKSEIADFKNVATADYANAGAIIAAIFLQQFIAPQIHWAHFDMNAYNATPRPGRPEGGEAVCLRGIFKYLSERFMRK